MSAPRLVLGLVTLLFVSGPVAIARSTASHEVDSAVEPACSAEQGQLFIDTGRYDHAIREFTCVIDADPTGVDGYRGRIEAELLLGRYSDAVADYQRVTAFVEPVQPDAKSIILAGYAAHLAVNSNDLIALTGASFARWWYFDYSTAIHLLKQLVDLQPDNVYGNLFRGSSRLLQGATRAQGVNDLNRAIELAPDSPDVQFIVSDAYTYGLPDPELALAAATEALDGGLDTPRVHAILASARSALGNELTAAAHIERHIELVTTQLLTTSPIAAGATLTLGLVPGRVYEIPVSVNAGDTIAISTGSRDFFDTIMVLLAPDGSPVAGSDDPKFAFAAIDLVAGASGTYLVRVTSFEAVNTGALLVTRD
jgi:Tetratricopeptide repeat